MTAPRRPISSIWIGLGSKFLPFADAATKDLPLGRLLRLSLFQVSAGMAMALLTGTMNRVMIVELGVPAWLVAVMISLPILFAPFRALIGHRSDTYKSVLGWRRGPFIWYGSLLMFGGLAIMPFALLNLAGAGQGPIWIGQAGAALAFLVVGAGLHVTQTAGLALATDLAPDHSRPRVVALLYVMLLVGMGLSAFVIGSLLQDFSHLRLVKVIQGCAILSFILNMVALWKQEHRQESVKRVDDATPAFRESWRTLMADPRAFRLLLTVGLGTAAFSMQDILLEPYGAEVLGMTVGQTTQLTSLFAAGTLVGFALAARQLGRESDPHRLAAFGLLIGVAGFSAVIFAAPMESALVFRIGTSLVGLGGGLFSVCLLSSAMSLARTSDSGIALGAWGAVQATAMGLALALGGAIRDTVEFVSRDGSLGPAFAQDAIGYSVVYHIEILLLFCSLAAIGPLVRYASPSPQDTKGNRFGLASFPG